MCNRLRVLPALRMGDGEHVERVVVVRIFVANKAQVRDRLVVPAAVDRERRRVEAFLDRLRSRLAGCRLAPADVQVQPHPLVKLALIGVLPENRFQEIHGGRIVVPLNGREPPLVHRHGLDRC